MCRKPSMACLVSILPISAGLTSAIIGIISAPPVFTAVIYFLTPAEDDIEVGLGVYQVEATDPVHGQ